MGLCEQVAQSPEDATMAILTACLLQPVTIGVHEVPKTTDAVVEALDEAGHTPREQKFHLARSDVVPA
jgi:hypothetical protein